MAEKESSSQEKKVPLDPMSEVFGPGSGIFHEPSEDNEAPDELLAVFEEYGISQKRYGCMLKLAGQNPNSYIKSFNSSYPSLEWITKNCGPGEYLLVFTWRAKDSATDRMKSFSETVPVEISEKAMEVYKDYQFEERLRRAKEKREKIAAAKLERQLDVGMDDDDKPQVPATIDPLEAGKKFVQQTMESANLLGLTRKESSFSFDKILAIAIPLLPALLEHLSKSAERQQQQFNQMMTLMMGVTNSSTAQLVEILKAQSGQNAAADAVKQYKDMLTGAIDLKEELAGMGKESLADKVFKLIEGVAPHVLALATMPRQQMVADPRYKFAQMYANTSPDVTALRSQPVEVEKLVTDLDDFYGWEQADGILQIAGISRPESCLRDPAKQFNKDDPRRQQPQYEERAYQPGEKPKDPARVDIEEQAYAPGVKQEPDSPIEEE